MQEEAKTGTAMAVPAVPRPTALKFGTFSHNWCLLL